ncbi:radical SAM protein, partial [Nanoarchaeota archaeon]
MKKTKYFSYKINSLPKGCQYCVQGSKLVMFITGLCPRNCFYCPISEQKYKKDVIYADEWPIKNNKDILTEAKLINAKGAGFTGGDPLKKLKRTILIIKKLKKKFGKKFHTHLYTSFNLVTENTLKKLHKAGLDEIRFHPDLDNQKLWSRINLAKKFKWDIGIEIPVIPNKKSQTIKLVDYFQDKVDFINLNELEIADAKHNLLTKLGYKPSSPYASSVKGSAQLAKQILKHLKDTKINVHFCTAKLKDAVQLANRIKRRAQNVKLPSDQVTEEGLLIRGVIYLPKLKPSFSYQKKIKNIKNKKT